MFATVVGKNSQIMKISRTKSDILSYNAASVFRWKIKPNVQHILFIVSFIICEASDDNLC